MLWLVEMVLVTAVLGGSQNRNWDRAKKTDHKQKLLYKTIKYLEMY